jgi:uncharacterized protein YjcR
MAKKKVEPKVLTKAEHYYLESLAGLKNLAEIAEDLGCQPEQIADAYKKAKAKSPGKFGRPSQGVTVMTEAAAIEGDDHGKAVRAGNKFMTRYAKDLYRGEA